MLKNDEKVIYFIIIIYIFCCIYNLIKSKFIITLLRKSARFIIVFFALWKINSNFVIVNNIVTAMSNKMMQQLIADYFKTQPIQKAWLFGSFARGEETPLSDVDLLVQYDDEGISLLKHAAMICELEEILDRPVDIVEDGTLLPFAVESANRDKKLIYERKS